MRFGWSFIICLWVVHTAFSEEERSDPPPKPGILDIFTKPKIPMHGFDIFTKPKIEIPGLDMFTKPKAQSSGFHINKHISTPFGGGSFGFGFGIGGHFGSSPGAGVNLPPAEKPEPGKHGAGWKDEDKEDAGMRPNWGEEEMKPKPGSYDDKKKPKPETYEEEKDSRPDWEEIGEKEIRSDDLMEGDLVGDGLIQPRVKKDRVKRFIESKIYHVALKKGFLSNARVSRVKFRRNDNSLNSGM